MFALVVLTALTTGCGDRCEQLCANVGSRLNDCTPASLSWADLGARNRSDFVNQCQRQWGAERIDLSASDLRLALDACDETNKDLPGITCDEILALYGNQ
jgi:hypothetical protein